MSQQQQYLKQNSEFLNDEFLECVLDKSKKKLDWYYKQRLQAIQKPSKEQIQKNYIQLLNDIHSEIEQDDTLGDIDALKNRLFLYEKYIYVYKIGKKKGYIHYDNDIGDLQQKLLLKIFKLREYKALVNIEEECVIDDKLKRRIKNCELPSRSRDEILLERDYNDLLEFYNSYDESRALPQYFSRLVRVNEFKKLLQS